MHQLPRGLMPGNRASGYRNFSATQFPTNGLLGNLALSCVQWRVLRGRQATQDYLHRRALGGGLPLFTRLPRDPILGNSESKKEPGLLETPALLFSSLSCFLLF